MPGFTQGWPDLGLRVPGQPPSLQRRTRLPCGVGSSSALAGWPKREADAADHVLSPGARSERRRLAFRAYAGIWRKMCGAKSNKMSQPMAWAASGEHELAGEP